MSRRTVEQCGSQRCDALRKESASRLATNHLGVRRLAAALVGAKLASRAVIARVDDFVRSNLHLRERSRDFPCARIGRFYLVNCRLVMVREITFS